MKQSLIVALLLTFSLAKASLHARDSKRPANLIVVPAPPGVSTSEAAPWRLVWRDEFDGTALDETKWSHRQLGPRESSMIAKECVSLDGKGHLVMTVFEKDGVLQNPMLGTQKKFQATYGIFAARIKFPQQQGQHGSFWMQPAGKSATSDDPKTTGAEIDIIEWFGKGREDGGTASNIYWPGASGAKANHAGGTKDFGLLPPGQTLSDKFHIFSLQWTPEGYVFRMDGKVNYRIKEGVSGVPQYMILSLLTADWEKSRLDRTKLPNAMQVDWVRVWQKASTSP
jgi:beta-glucanase (GH16 family)